MLRAVAIAALVLTGCLQETHILEQTGDTGTALSAQERLGLTDAQVSLILEFLNDCGTTLGELDDDVPLDKDAAESLVGHRDGADGTCGTSDDDLFDDLDEVDFVPNVGDASILAILAYLEGSSGTTGGGGEWEGVSFTSEEVAVVLEIANQASYEVLDVDVALPSNAVDEIIDARPHDTMDHLAETPQVGPSALQKLKDYVPSWSG